MKVITLFRSNLIRRPSIEILNKTLVSQLKIINNKLILIILFSATAQFYKRIKNLGFHFSCKKKEKSLSKKKNLNNRYFFNTFQNIQCYNDMCSLTLHMMYERMAPEDPMRAPTIVIRLLLSIKPSAHRAQPE